jgi:sugar phosphate permease
VYARARHELLKNPVVLSSVLARGFPIVAWFTFITHNSIIVVQILDETTTVAGVLVVVASISYATAASQAGRVAKFFAGPATPLVAGNCCLGVGLSVVLGTDSLFVVVLAVAVTGVGFGIQLPLYRSLITNLASPELRGGLVNIAETGDRVTASITPVVLGAVIVFVEPAVGFRRAIQLAVLLGASINAGGGPICLGIIYSTNSASCVRFGLTDT